jgi:cell division protein FtsL
MKIASIHIYSRTGERRDLKFNTEGLNIITGKSSTGKSALSEIIEYCMARSSFNVPDGVIEESVSWYAVIYQFPGEQVMVAKPAPKSGAMECGMVMLKRGVEIDPPAYDQLEPNDNDNGVESLLSRLVGIPENATDVSMEHSRVSFDANIKHTYYYLFQKQGFVASKDQLFYRQNEDHQPQAIRDTFPILFGASSADKYKLTANLRSLQRQFRINQKTLDQAKLDVEQSTDRSISLLSEAKSVGIIPQTTPDDQPIVELLKSATIWRPQLLPEEDESRISQIELDLKRLREERQSFRKQIEGAQRFSLRASGFEFEANEQRDRLASIRSLPKDDQDGWQWPFVSEAIDLENPIAESLLRELSSLDQEMKMMETEKPQLEAFVVAQEAEVERINKEIAAREQELAAAISANEKIAEMGNRNTAAARVVGRISLFLETFATDEELHRLEQTQSRLENRISALERQIGDDDAQERLLSVLNGISSKISAYVQELGGEFGAYPARLDLRKLTVVFDRPGRLTYMDRTGGGENHLAYHLGTLLSLHRYAFEGKHPIPRFLMIDQPSQVYFPSEDVYKSVGGSIERTEADSDMETVRRLFRLLHDYTQKHVPGFQIIVTEHANLRDAWYQSAIIETPWTKPPALVPESWF